MSGSHSAGGSPGPADLRIAIAPDRTAVPVGGTIRWRIRADDANGAAAVNAWVDVTLPRGTEVVAMNADRGPGCSVRTQGDVHCNLDWLSADAPVGNVVLVTRMELPGIARLTVTTGADGGDAAPGDNATTASASVGPLSWAGPPTPPVALAHIAFVPGSVSCARAPEGTVTIGAILTVSEPAKMKIVIHDRRTGGLVWILGGSSLGETRSTVRAESLSTEIPGASSVRLAVHVIRRSGPEACSLMVRVAARGAGGTSRIRFPLRPSTISAKPLAQR